VQSLTRSSSTDSESAICWVAIWALTIITVVGIVAGLGKVLNLLFPLGAFAVGILLYQRNSVLYLGFNWWIWCLTAFVRRLADFYGSYTEPSPILLAPYLVTIVCFWTMLRYLPQAKRLGGLSFVLAGAGVLYGFFIGLVAKGEAFPVFRGTLDWLVPIPFGFYLLVNWRQYLEFRQNTYRVFTWLAIVMGIYGVIQFVSLPEWDRSWLVLSEFTVSGNPDEGVRIWSTMQSGEPFAAFMAGLLLVLLISNLPLSLPASIVGYVSFLLALVRSGWLGWAAGLLTLVASLKAKFQMRLVVIAIVLSLAVVPIATMEQFSDRIATRLDSLTNVQEDTSARGRQEAFRTNINKALVSMVGEGIGRETQDSNLLAMLFYLGWIGSLLYSSGFILLLLEGFTNTDIRLDPFIGAARAVAMTTIIRIPVNGSLLGVSGMLFWGFLAFTIAATRFYRYKQTNSLNSL
jgi:hypothetical protein